MITMDNYEGWLMRYADNALTADERREVEAFIAAHPDLHDEMDSVAAVRVTPLPSAMPHKERLLRREAVPLWRWVAAAAIMAAMVATPLFVMNRQPRHAGSGQIIAEAEPVQAPTFFDVPSEPDTTKREGRISKKHEARKPAAPKLQATDRVLAMETVAPSLPVDIPDDIPDESPEPQETTLAVADTTPVTVPLPQSTATVGIVVPYARLAVNPIMESLAIK